MKNFLLVFIGSGIGGVLRYALSRALNRWHTPIFPVGTLCVNMIACFVLGGILALADQKQIISLSTKLFLTVGLCGGFSTFSAFSNETLLLLGQGNYLLAMLYIMASILLCIVALALGMFLV